MKIFSIVANLILLSVITFAQKDTCQYSLASRSQNLSQIVDLLDSTQLKTINKKSSIPKFIKKILNCWTDKFDIANPNKPYQSSDVVVARLKPLPSRQLTHLGISDHLLLITYRRGGRGASDYIVIFRFESNQILDFWIGSGASLASQEEVVYFLKNHKDLFLSTDTVL